MANIIIDNSTVPATIVVSGEGPRGAVGPIGPPGPAGGAGYALPTNSAIEGNKAITTVAGFATYADCSNVNKSAVGISIGAVDSGDDVIIQSGGKMTVIGAGWTSAAFVYLGANGALTQVYPTTGFVQELGIAHNSETLLIAIKAIGVDGGNYT